MFWMQAIVNEGRQAVYVRYKMILVLCRLFKWDIVPLQSHHFVLLLPFVYRKFSMLHMPIKIPKLCFYFC